MQIPQAPSKGYNFDPEAMDSPEDRASFSRWIFCFQKILFQLTEGPLGCPHVVAQNPHNNWFALGGSSSPPHLLPSTNTHNNTAVILSLFMCLKVIPDLWNHYPELSSLPFCPVSSRGQGYCWNMFTQSPLSVDILYSLFCLLQISSPSAFMSAPIIGQK